MTTNPISGISTTQLRNHPAHFYEAAVLSDFALGMLDTSVAAIGKTKEDDFWFSHDRESLIINGIIIAY